jgi:hypothetical protein
MSWILCNLVSVRFEIVLVLVQERCTVCSKRTISLEIVLDAPNGPPSFEAQVEAHFSPFGIVLILMQDSCMVWAKRSMPSETILDAPKGTPR